jgi:integrase
MKLTSKRVARLLKQPGRYHDGHGLHLQVTGPRNASWLLRYQRHGRERWMGLGPVHTVTLAAARERARAARLSLLDGVDPLEARHAAKAAAKLSTARKLTFEAAARAYHKANEGTWRSSQHSTQWLRSLEKFAFPVIGAVEVAAITKPDVLRVVEPIWHTRTVTADRVRNRIEAILDWAMARDHRPEGANPARWTGFLDKVLPAAKKIAKPTHFAALPYDDLPVFMAKLRRDHSIAALALQFAIMTSARSSEALDAVWSEIDLDKSLWVLPDRRMKGGREHRVLLSAPVIELLRALPREDSNPHVFIGGRAGGSVSNASVRRLLMRLHDGITQHGFRSCFSDWAHERTGFDHHSIEISLAHKVGSDVEEAYRRGPMLAKRRQLMDAWGRFCVSKPVTAGDNIVTLGSAQ